jgi:hypothetical protein
MSDPALAHLVEASDVVAGYLPGVDILNGCNLTLAEGDRSQRCR